MAIRILLIAATAALLNVMLTSFIEASQTTRSEITILINESGIVEVVDRWSDMVQESGEFNYFSAAREIGVLPLEVINHGFTVSFSTKSYLRYEDGYYYFITPDYYYADGPLDVELSLTYPVNLVLQDATPEPDYNGDGVLHWSLSNVAHDVVIARFERVEPFVQPERSGPEWQVNPASLVQLRAEELPVSADDVLKELENVIDVARASKVTDPEFIRVLEKLLAKFYYIFSAQGLLLEYNADFAGESPTDNSIPTERTPAADGKGQHLEPLYW